MCNSCKLVFTMVVGSVLILLLVGVVVSEGTPTTLCGPNEFPCNDGACIDKSRWCDSAQDCADDSDEYYCYKRTTYNPDPNRCRDTFFRCKDGPCIPVVGRCDGYQSCHDKSDEHDCGDSNTTFASTEMVINVTAHVTTMQPAPKESTRYKKTAEHEDIISTSTEHMFASTLGHEVVLNTNIQSDSVAPKVVKTNEVDITKGFVNVDAHYFSHEKSNAESWLLSTRNEEYGWGEDTARAVTALYLSNPDLLRMKTDANMLMSKQLHLKISISLIRNETKELTLSELSSYINALHASCDNPRNFHGHDLVEILKQRTTLAQGLGQFVSPLVYLTLCISGATTFEDAKRVQEMLFGAPKVDKLDIQALVSLAASCISSVPKFYSLHLDQQNARRMFYMATELGLPDNIYVLSLVIQALNEAKVNQDLWNRPEALRKVSKLQQQNGSFGDVLSTYYTMPVLSGQSLVSLAKHCFKDEEKGMVPVEVLMNGKEQKDFVQYSLYFGNPVEVTQTLRIRVRKSSNILDVMRIAAATNAVYRFKTAMTRGKPLIYSIGGIVNDAEKGLYWTLEIASRKNATEPEKLVPYHGDIRSYFPSASDHIVFWMKHLY